MVPLLLIYGRPAPNKADYTQVRFWTSDVAADVRDLAASGVTFEDLQLSDAQDRRPRRDDGGRGEVDLV